jgi:hypothetical protein
MGVAATGPVRVSGPTPLHQRVDGPIEARDAQVALSPRETGDKLAVGESIATLTKHRLLSDELVLDWLWIEGIWARVAPAALRQRERFGEPRLYENFEALAARG